MSDGNRSVSASERAIAELLAHADVRLNGDRPWDMTVHRPELYSRVLASGSLGLGEAYMDGWWDCPDLEGFFFRVLRANLPSKIKPTWNGFFALLQSKLFNMQNRRRARKVAEEHYDLDNDFYMAFLDPYNQYTCGYFKDTEDLNEAQEKKLDMICRKLQLKSADKVLDIGCGWGGFSKFAAQHYGCHVTGITISDEQLAFARDYCKGLPVTIERRDYRDVKDSFDKIVIVGMIEHVGYKNYRRIMEVVHRSLKDDGIFLLHTIGSNKSGTMGDPWLMKYIFPNSMLPSIKQLAEASERLFVMEDWHNIGAHYTKTLLAWNENMMRNWQQFAQKYSDRFRRMFEYYFLCCAGGFHARYLQLWQVVMTKHGIVGGYAAPR